MDPVERVALAPWRVFLGRPAGSPAAVIRADGRGGLTVFDGRVGGRMDDVVGVPSDLLGGLERVRHVAGGGRQEG